MPTYNYYNPNELYHHGIMGMRWGKRHGPPYPLAPSAHSSEEKRLKSQNEGKLESWKARETAKVHKKYDKKIASGYAKVNKLSRYGGTERSDALERKIDRLRDERALQLEAINSTPLRNVNPRAISVGADIAMDTLAYYAHFKANSAAREAIRLGNYPMAALLIGGALGTKLFTRRGVLKKHNERDLTAEEGNANYNDSEYLSKQLKKAQDDYQKARAKSGSSDRPYMKKIYEEVHSGGRISDNTLTEAMRNDDVFRKNGRMLALQEIKYEKTEGIKGSVVSRAKSMRSRGKTYAEIAERLGIDDHAVWSMVNDDL